MKKGKKIASVLIVVLVLGFGFYWLFMRPVFARESCANLATYGAQQASKSSKINPTIYNEYYTECLESKGL